MIILRFLLPVILLSSNPVIGQKAVGAGLHAFHLEAGGPGPYGSVHYEYSFWQKDRFITSGRIGLSTMKVMDFRRKFNPDLIIPVTFSGMFGKNHRLELMAGISASSKVNALNMTTFERQNTINGTAGLLYRYEADILPVVFRLGYNPILEEFRNYRHWFALSIGYRFG